MFLLALVIGFAFLLQNCQKEDLIIPENEGNSTDQSTFTKESVKVCHKDAVEIVTDEAALEAHIAHGDAVDMDDDGFYDIDNPCSATDCNDYDNNVNPSAEEICGDGIDNNCNGEIDELCDTFTYVPDDNFEQELIDLGYDDILDDYVNTNNISTVTTLGLGFLNISDLTGIEDFTSLRNLNCRNNQITSLDLSQNIALRSLDCTRNQITSLDVSNNVNLISFHCFSNQLTSLDVTQNTALLYFTCGSNLLSSIDVTQNTSLIIFSTDNNPITDIDISNNTALEQCFFYNNQLTSLDVSNNVNLTYLYFPLNNINLRQLHCNSNQLTSLDVSLTPTLTHLNCFSNPNLTCIQVSSAQLASIPSTWNKDPIAVYSENCGF